MKHFVFFFLTLLSLSASTDYKTKIEQLSLDRHPDWYTLLHFKHGQSEIDDPIFFLSKTGKTDPKSELLATITAMLSDPTDDDNSTVCIYPARLNFITEHIPELKEQIPHKSCTKLRRFLKEIDPHSLTLSFPTAHINSPASMFGHTLLRVNSDVNSSLISNAINYAAITDETNGFIFAYQGLFGGYEGRYSIMPYYKKIEEYNGLENRDIWEYTLNFNEAESRRIVLYTFELSRIYSDYFFLSENCSYNLLWLLQHGKKSQIDLVSGFNYTATPIDTIRELRSHHLIQDGTFRHSKNKLIKHIFTKVDSTDRVIDFMQSGYDPTYLEGLDRNQSIYTLDIATNVLQADYISHRIDKATYTKNFIKLLRDRSKLGKIAPYDVPEADNPLKSDPGHKVSIGGFRDNSFHLSYRPTYHDIYDIEKGYISGAYITFFDFIARFDEQGRSSLDRIGFLDIRSYAVRDFYFKPISWEVNVAAERLSDGNFYLKLKTGAGLSYGNDTFILYLMALPFGLAGEQTDYYGISGKVGTIINFDHYKLGGYIERSTYSDNLLDEQTSGEAYLTRYINENFNLGLRYQKREFAGEQYGLFLYWKF